MFYLTWNPVGSPWPRPPPPQGGRALMAGVGHRAGAAGLLGTSDWVPRRLVLFPSSQDAQGNATTHVMYPKQNGQSSDVAASNCCARVIGGLECYIGKAVAVVDCNLYVVTDRSKYTTPSFFRMLKSTVGPSRGGWRVRACCSPPANFARFASSRTAADDKGVPLYTQYKELAQRQLRMFVGRGAHKLPHLDFGEARARLLRGGGSSVVRMWTLRR